MGNILNSTFKETMMQNRVVLTRRDLLTLVAGSFLSSLCVTVINLLLTIRVYQDTGSSIYAVSALFIITFLPNLIAAPLFSGLSDRFNRRLVLGGCGLGRAIICLLLLQKWSFYFLLIFGFLITCVSSVAKPARYALIAQLVSGQQRITMNSLVMITSTISGVLGGIVAALLNTMDGRKVFGVMTVLSVLGAVLDIAFFKNIHINSSVSFESNDESLESELKHNPSIFKRLIEGLHWVYSFPELKVLTIVTTILWFGLGIQEPLLVAFVDRILSASTSMYGYLNTVGSVGALIGAFLSTPFGKNRRMAAQSFSVGLIGAGGSFMCFAFSGKNILLAVIFFFAFSACVSVSNVIDEYLEQEMSPNRLRARIISTIGAIGTAGFLIGGGLSGVGINLIGTQWMIVCVGVVILLAGIYSYFAFRFIRIELK